MDFSKFDFVITGDPSKHRLLDLFEVNDRACLPQRQHGSCRFVSCFVGLLLLCRRFLLLPYGRHPVTNKHLGLCLSAQLGITFSC